MRNDVTYIYVTFLSVTKFGKLIENMSRMGLYDCHICWILFHDFMRNSNFVIGVLHVEVKY